jgi:predicted O-methyltransferase YrrM
MDFAQRFNDCVARIPRGFTKYMKFKNMPCDMGAEIGVHYGLNAEDILRTLIPRKLFLIDPYEDYVEAGLDFPMPSEIEDSMIRRLDPYIDQTVFLREISETAIPRLPSNLDFIYIDGCHDKEFVYKDLELSYGKVREGGVIGGHDFQIPMVRDALDVYCEVNDLSYLTLDFDYIIQK